MRFKSMHENNHEDRLKGLPNFLQVLHKIKPQKHFHVQKQQNNDQYESILFPYDKKNRYAINLDTGSSSQSDCQVIQMLRDPKIQCQKLNKKIVQAKKYQNRQQIMYDILIKYISILNPIKQLKKLQPLVDSLSCSYTEIQPLVPQIKSKLCQALVFQKFGVYDKAFQAFLYYIKSLLFCAKNQGQSKVLSISRQKSLDLKDCFLRILRICQKQFWQSRKQTNFINLLQNVQVFIESQQQIQDENLYNSLIDFLLLTIKKICSNLSPRMIKNSFFEKHSIQLNSEIYKQLSEKFFLTLKSHQPFYKSAWKCFQISDKKAKMLKREKKKKAISVKKFCNFCQCPLFEDNLIKIYGCGHSFHSYCDGEKQSCIECSYISDQRLYENIIYSKIYEKQSQSLEKDKSRKKQQKIKYIAQQKEQKLFYLKRKFKMFDYQQYSRQKTTMNLMRAFDSSNFF